MPDRRGSGDRVEATHDRLVQFRNDLVAHLGAVLDTERGLREILTCTGIEGDGASLRLEPRDQTPSWRSRAQRAAGGSSVRQLGFRRWAGVSVGLFAGLVPHAENSSLQEGCDGRGEKIPQVGDLNVGGMGRGELGDGHVSACRRRW